MGQRDVSAETERFDVEWRCISRDHRAIFVYGTSPQECLGFFASPTVDFLQLFYAFNLFAHMSLHNGFYAFRDAQIRAASIQERCNSYLVCGIHRTWQGTSRLAGRTRESQATERLGVGCFGLQMAQRREIERLDRRVPAAH